MINPSDRRDTYYYDKKGAGFTSLLDSDGHDWIGCRPGGGSAGEYRGIPNLGPCCHPGYDSATTQIVSAQRNYAELVSEGTGSDGALFRVRWRFWFDRAQLTIEQAPSSYYMLYEGTPGANVGAEDYFVTSEGLATRTVLTTSGDPIKSDLSAPEWIYFEDTILQRALLLVHHEDDAIAERYWTMNSQMTVFGFGRTAHGGTTGMSAAPQHLSLALVENVTFAKSEARAAAMVD